MINTFMMKFDSAQRLVGINFQLFKKNESSFADVNWTIYNTRIKQQ
jgi:hypothetical protein